MLTEERRLLIRLRREGLSVRAEHGRLFVSPPAKVTDNYRKEIAANKDRLLAYLAAERADDAKAQSLYEAYQTANRVVGWNTCVSPLAWFQQAESIKDVWREFSKAAEAIFTSPEKAA